jgi:hypothetical protein
MGEERRARGRSRQTEVAEVWRVLRVGSGRSAARGRVWRIGPPRENPHRGLSPQNRLHMFRAALMTRDGFLPPSSSGLG